MIRQRLRRTPLSLPRINKITPAIVAGSRNCRSRRRRPCSAMSTVVVGDAVALVD
jgi:hypothetical protein